MIQLISLHLPRTAGTTLYQILQQVYGKQLSISLRRRDYKSVINKGIAFQESLSPKVEVLHGHLYYSEVRSIHMENNSKMICWLREPTARVISNYRFFIHGLHNPAKNPTVNQLNKHRINESLIDYARLEENRNRMSKFLNGIALEDLFFYGLLESFEEDILQLSKALNWPEIKIPHLNNVPNYKSVDLSVDEKVVQEIKELNALDYELYKRALVLKNLEVKE